MKVREGIGELRQICQATAPSATDQQPAFRFLRRLSIYLTWVLLHFSIRANHVTVLGIVTGIAAGVLFGSRNFLAGIAALWVAMLLDFCDGEVSRYRKSQSKEGSYLDKVYHFTVQPSAFAGITIGAYLDHPSLWVLTAGFISTVSVPAFVMVTGYANELAVWKHARRLIQRLTMALEAAPDEWPAGSDLPDPKSLVPTPAAPRTVSRPGMVRRLAALSGLWDFPYTFFVVTVAVLIHVYAPVAAGFSSLALLLGFYAVTLPCWIAAYVTHVLSSRATERGYLAFVDELSLLLSHLPARAPRVLKGITSR